jgi:RNA polymerase sigma-70 factor (ECF subfamily)
MSWSIMPIEHSELSSVPDVCTRAVAGDETRERRLEFDGLLPHILPRFRRMAMRWLRHPEDAEDAVQDAILSAFRHLVHFDGRSQMSTWLTAILRNAVRMQLRRRRRVEMYALAENPETGRPSLLETLSDPRPTPEQSLEQRELCELVRRLRSGLPPSQQAALNFRIQDDLSIKEVADWLGTPVGTVKAQLARGRANLATRVHKAMGTPRRVRQWENQAQRLAIQEFLGSRRGGSSIPA